MGAQFAKWDAPILRHHPGPIEVPQALVWVGLRAQRFEESAGAVIFAIRDCKPAKQVGATILCWTAYRYENVAAVCVNHVQGVAYTESMQDSAWTTVESSRREHLTLKTALLLLLRSFRN